ncbi:hypothetical protein DRA46_02805 [Burkholderia gladioli]|nr:hypothetical protein [Burkholderia gladioli]
MGTSRCPKGKCHEIFLFFLSGGAYTFIVTKTNVIRASRLDSSVADNRLPAVFFCPVASARLHQWRALAKGTPSGVPVSTDAGPRTPKPCARHHRIAAMMAGFQPMSVEAVMRANALARPEQTRSPFIFRKALHIVAAAQPPAACDHAANDALHPAKGIQADETQLAQLAVSAALAAAYSSSADTCVRGSASFLDREVDGIGGAVLRVLSELSVHDLAFVMARAIPAGVAHHDCVRRTDAREHALAYIEQFEVADTLRALDLRRALARRLTCRYFGGTESIASIVDIFGLSESTARRRARAVAEVLELIESKIWARLVPLLRDVGALDPAWQSSHGWNLERRGGA